MSKFIYALTISIVISSFFCNLAMSTDEEVELSQEQKEFAQKVAHDTGFKSAKWVNSYTLEVTIDPLFRGITDNSNASLYANIEAAQGYLFTGKNICVKIIDPELGELAYECAGEQFGT